MVGDIFKTLGFPGLDFSYIYDVIEMDPYGLLAVYVKLTKYVTYFIKENGI